MLYNRKNSNAQNNQITNHSNNSNLIPAVSDDQQQQQPHPNRLTPPPNSVLKISRYEEDFCEIEKVGKGGYGSVYKVQNRLDGLYYALKKIPFKNTTQTFLDKVLREVKTLASLNHRNIVRYHSAWLETENVPLRTSSSYNSAASAATNNDVFNHTANTTASTLIDGNWGTTNTDDDLFTRSPPFEIDGIEKKLKSPLNNSTIVKKKKKTNEESEDSDSESDDSEDGYDHSLNKLQFPPDFEEEFRNFGKQAKLRESMFPLQDDSDDESTNTTNSNQRGFFRKPSKKFGSNFSLDSLDHKKSIKSSNRDDSSCSESESEFEEDQSDSCDSDSFEDSDDQLTDEESDAVDEEDSEEIFENPKKFTSTTPPVSMPGTNHNQQSASTSLLSSSSSLKRQISQQVPPLSSSFKSSTSPPKGLCRLTTLYIVMQLYSQTLGQWLENRSPDAIKEEDNLNIFKQICIGLRYIHSKGIIHRDLKPGNIFLVRAQEDSTGCSPGAGFSSSFSEENDVYGDWLVSLGDFGLAVQHISSVSPTPSPTPTSTPSLTPVNSQFLFSSINGMVSQLPNIDGVPSNPPNPSVNSILSQNILSLSSSSSFSSSNNTPSLINAPSSILSQIPNLTISQNTINANTNNQNSLSSSTTTATNTNNTSTSLNRSIEHFKHTSAVGTMTYSSPEQKKGLYNEKTDIYSLGIILFELYYPISTKMEKARVLSDLRNGILPKTFLQKFPKIADLVLAMMKSNPEERPSATDILKSEIFGQILSVSEMEYIIKHQQNIIEQLKQQIYQLKSPLLNSDDVPIF